MAVAESSIVATNSIRQSHKSSQLVIKDPGTTLSLLTKWPSTTLAAATRKVLVQLPVRADLARRLDIVPLAVTYDI